MIPPRIVLYPYPILSLMMHPKVFLLTQKGPVPYQSFAKRSLRCGITLLRTIGEAILASCAATRPATHSVPSHHEETKYHHPDHDDGEDPPETKTISKPSAWKHMGLPPFLLIGR